MSPPAAAASEQDTKKIPSWKIWTFLFVLVLDGLNSGLLLTPWVPHVRRAEGDVTSHYTMYGSVIDLAIIATLRITACVLALLVMYSRGKSVPDHPFNPLHPNGDKKSREELELEALEEPWSTYIGRYISRASFTGEGLAVLTQLLAVTKALLRMHIEIGDKQDDDPYHPVFWLVLLATTVFARIESAYLESIVKLVASLGEMRSNIEVEPSLIRRIGSSLSVPLLAGAAGVDDDGSGSDENDSNSEPETPPDPDTIRGTSDIGPDANYKATWKDLIAICKADVHLIMFAFVFLLLAAIAQVYIPRFLGNILDALAAEFADHDDDSYRKIPMKDVPGFVRNVKYLVVASVAAGVFAGARGSIFTYVGARVNVRLRIRLMDSLLAQDIGFFDVTKTGDITSRLSSDTTLVGDQVSLNVNVFMRSLVQACGVLLFMFLVSWQLSIVAFVSVPLITHLSKVYGNFIRSLTKLMQKKLADGNSVSEAALGSMATVRSFDAAESELKDFETHMFSYLAFNFKSAVAYSGYAAFVTSLPQLVFAVVVYYGGLLVRNGDMTSGQLVSFLLYLQSLSDAFSSIGYVFSSLTQAVGAADKVFELLHRRPRYMVPSTDPPASALTRGRIGIETSCTRRQRLHGLAPDDVTGEISLNNVQLYYPARPQRRILNDLTLNIPSGSIVALVGQSGGGKSSVMSLIQHLYEPQTGQVLLDGKPVHELSPSWLSRHISIVSQEPTLFARSIKRNIMYGLEGTDMEPSDEEIIAAAKLANAHDFIQKMPQKYDTEVGERGVQLSGGQKQRIAIARALVRKPKVLLLDEATSALDAESEHLVQQAIDDMLAKAHEQGSGAMTVLIVAHRLSTVRNADTIFVISDGQVVEQGSHNELVKNTSGPYMSLIKRQMEAQDKLENAPTEAKIEEITTADTTTTNGTSSNGDKK